MILMLEIPYLIQVLHVYYWMKNYIIRFIMNISIAMFVNAMEITQR